MILTLYIMCIQIYYYQILKMGLDDHRNDNTFWTFTEVALYVESLWVEQSISYKIIWSENLHNISFLIL